MICGQALPPTIPGKPFQFLTMPTEIATYGEQASAPGTPLRAGSSGSSRIPALDFTKGALVLIMVLYHWVNYFIGPQWPYYRYLRFLTPSFIFISGFMISHVYLSKYATADARLTRRLITRGVKLLAIFLLLNVARVVVVSAFGSGAMVQNSTSLRSLAAFLVFGTLPSEGPKVVSFSILVPISYLLISAGVLVRLHRRYRWSFHVVCFCLLLASVILGYVNAPNYNVECVAVGMIGVVAGFTSIRTIDNLGKRPYLLAASYICYLAAITIWNVPFALLIVSVLLNLCILYLLGARGGKISAARKEVILLGRYSLLAYISQVAILQVLSKVYQRVDPGAAKLSSSLFAAAVLTILTIRLVDRARTASANADRLYKTIFA
jgi:peptidoglycan/LPS O-acetylase OafA/YrhL